MKWSALLSAKATWAPKWAPETVWTIWRTELLPLPRLESRIAQPYPNNSTDWSVVAHSNWMYKHYFDTITASKCPLSRAPLCTLKLFLVRNSPLWAKASSFSRFLDHTQWSITVSRTPLDEWSARRRNLYQTIHNTHNRQTSMALGGIRTHNLSRRATADPRLRPRGHRDRHTLQRCMETSLLLNN